MNKHITRGTRIAKELRKKCNKLTAEERAYYHKLGMDIINGSIVTTKKTK